MQSMNHARKISKAFLFCSFFALFLGEYLLFPLPALSDSHPLLKEIIIAYNSKALRQGLTDGSYRGEDGILVIRPEIGKSLGMKVFIDQDYLEPMLRKLGLISLLDHWTSSEEAESCKPDPNIFHHALRKAGCRKEEVMFVGDSRVHDIQGARAVGMTTVLIAEEGGVSHLDDEHFDARPDHVIANLSELLDLVDERDSGSASDHAP